VEAAAADVVAITLSVDDVAVVVIVELIVVVSVGPLMINLQVVVPTVVENVEFPEVVFRANGSAVVVVFVVFLGTAIHTSVVLLRVEVLVSIDVVIEAGPSASPASTMIMSVSKSTKASGCSDEREFKRSVVKFEVVLVFPSLLVADATFVIVIVVFIVEKLVAAEVVEVVALVEFVVEAM
jgi:hypothetical protein